MVPDSNAANRKSLFGIPGTKPKRRSTAVTGIHAFVNPICDEIWPAKSLSSEEILVTIVAVAIASKSEGI